MKKTFVCLLLLLGTISRADFRPNRKRVGFVSYDQVSAAIRNELAKTGFEKITFDKDDLSFIEVPLRSQSATLHIVRITIDIKERILQARLRCAENECLPFIATVNLIDEPQFSRSRYVVLDSSLQRGKQKTIHAGEKALFRTTVPGVSISMWVRCLQSGAIGEMIRVLDPSTKRVFMGRIQGEGLVSAGGEQ